MRTLVFAAACSLAALSACGSSDATDLFGPTSNGGSPEADAMPHTGGGTAMSSGATSSGGALSATGGAAASPSTGGAGATGGNPSGATAGGGTAGSGGNPSSGGTAAGGTSAGGGAGAPAVMGSGGSLAGGSGGVASDAGASTTPMSLPVGGLISQQCADCTDLACSAETDACLADPACVATMECLTTCFALGCAGCFLGGVSPTLTALNECTNSECPICPTFNSGG